MAEEPTSNSGGYGKRPIWQWVVIYLVIAVIVYGLIYYFIAKRNGGYNAPNSNPYSQGTENPSSSNQPANENGSPAASQNVVTYTDSGFSPDSLTIKKGDTVTFQNTASDAMRVASNPHPMHNGYPTTGGCVSSTFDSCSDIQPNQSWSFTFDVVGNWDYHNHSNPSEGGTIVVQ